MSAEEPPVVAVEWCRWCRRTLPVAHDCVGDPTPCQDRQEDGSTCGTCPVCIAAQLSDPRYGSPGDLPEVGA